MMNKPTTSKLKPGKAAPPRKPAPKKPPAADAPLTVTTPTVKRRRYKYDICFSFAGENREYVHRVAKCLQNRNVIVFYDNDEKADLWGKDLPEHFDTLYQKQARYCVMFISEFYKTKLWTRLERRSALTRAMRSKKEYILPAYFDDTTVPGVRKSLAHIDLRTHKPLQLALEIIKKLRKDCPADERFAPPKPKKKPAPRKVKPKAAPPS